MSNLNGRLTRLERAIPTAAKDDGRREIFALCETVLAMIAAGELIDWTGQDFERYISPRVARGLPPERHDEVWRVRELMAAHVDWWAVETGWRSPSQEGTWRSYRANTAAEMADVAREIIEIAEEVIGKKGVTT